MVKIRKWRTRRLSQLPIAHFSCHPNVTAPGSRAQPQRLLSGASEDLSLRISEGLSLSPKAVQSSLQTDPLFSFSYPTTFPSPVQPLACLLVGTQLRPSSEAHWTDAYTVHASIDRYTCPLVSSLDYMSTCPVKPM